MNRVIIREARFSELFTDLAFPLMAAAYASESGTAEYGPASVDTDWYIALEDSGQAKLIVAECLDSIVGFAVVMEGYHGHFSEPIAILETIYVDPAFRRGATGIKLIKRAQEYAKRAGFDFMSASAPIDSRLNKLYERMGRATDVEYLFKLGGNDAY